MIWLMLLAVLFSLVGIAAIALAVLLPHSPRRSRWIRAVLMLIGVEELELAAMFVFIAARVLAPVMWLALSLISVALVFVLALIAPREPVVLLWFRVPYRVVVWLYEDDEANRP